MNFSVLHEISIYDTTLRDGAQTSGVDFTVVDKQEIALMLDHIGVDYIEGGWPGANPTDDMFFREPPLLSCASLSAFGMTRRKGLSAEEDPGLATLLAQGTQTICVVGKSWNFHVTEALGVSLDENIAMIGESIAYLVSRGKEVIFDAEHYFDGYKTDSQYTLACAKAAYAAGARWVVLCDTNGGSMPREIASMIEDIQQHIPGTHLGIHCHNDTDQAVANSLVAAEAGVCQIQGTVNGLGERCGNANLSSILPTLILKMGMKVKHIHEEKLQSLTSLSRNLDERLNQPYARFAPYVGTSAFAHKGGLHVSAVLKHPESYEHIPPESVGNTRDILVSNQAGRSNIIARLKQLGFHADQFTKEEIHRITERVKEAENNGYAYDAADAGFYLLTLEELHQLPDFFTLVMMRCSAERRRENNDRIICYSEASTKLRVKGEEVFTVAAGNGPVNALDRALKKALLEFYPSLQHVHLHDYKVRILNPKAATSAVTRVMIESYHEVDGDRWTTVGVSSNIIDASYNALRDSFTYHLLKKEKDECSG